MLKRLQFFFRCWHEICYGQRQVFCSNRWSMKKRKNKYGQQLNKWRQTNGECFITDETTFQQKQQGKGTILELGKFGKLSSAVRQKTHVLIYAIETIHNILIVEFSSPSLKISSQFWKKCSLDCSHCI